MLCDTKSNVGDSCDTFNANGTLEVMIKFYGLWDAKWMVGTPVWSWKKIGNTK